MKKVVYALFLVLTISCIEGAFTEVNQSFVQTTEYADTLGLEAALVELDDFNESVFGDMAKSRKSISEIETVVVPSTKSLTAEDITAYVINYKDDLGFAVINADVESVSIIARAEYGNMDADRLNRRISDVLNYAETKTDNNGSVGKNYSPEEYIYDIIANALITTPQSSRAVLYGSWRDVNCYGPYVTVKWNQTYPFNLKMPSHPDWLTSNYSYYRGLPPVGCSNVAIAQMLSAIKRPTYAPGNGTTYSWGALKTISNYSNVSDYLPDLSSYPFDTNPILLSKVEDLADCLRRIYDLNNSETDADGTSSSINNALVTMKSLDSEYFSDARILDYNEANNNVMAECMLDAKPVYCRGGYVNGNTISGHAWVVDGYLQRERNYWITTEAPSIAQTYVETAYFFHINWGYSGKYDGYYHTGVFDMSQREGYDQVIDTNPNTNEGIYVFSSNVKFISY